jgi:DNA-binding response OmpR family regulator
MMPKMNGLEVCKTIKKESDIPIIILSAKDAAEDRVQGLENGADDYVTKPFNLKELELRITARLRPQNENSKTKRYVFKDLIIDYEQRQVLLKNNSVELTPLEFDLLWFLASHPNRLIEHQELLTKIWGRQEINPNLLHVYMRKLRNKLEISPKNPAHIHNVWEQGYIFKS